MDLYDWQKKIIEHEGNVTIRGGRQTGKSESVSERIHYLAKKYPKSTHLIIAASERQENYLLEKLKDRIGKRSNYKKRPTLTKLPLTNGTVIWKFPVGQTGKYLEGLSSVDFLHADEAIHIFPRVWDSILPMLAEPRKRGLGWITLLSSTQGKPKGFFHHSFTRPDFLKIQVKAEDCPHICKEFLAEEKIRLGEEMYNVVYNGEFSEFACMYFPREVIDRCPKIYNWSLKAEYNKHASYYLGIDPARFGKSKAAFCIVEIDGEKIKVVEEIVILKSSLLHLQSKVFELHKKFNFRRIFIDDGGFGAGLVDVLMDRDSPVKRIVRALNNKGKGTEGKILKEDLYSNALRLIETKKIELLNRKEFIEDLKKVEFNEQEKIIGTDRSEAFVRACWGIKEKKLKLYLY